LMTGDRRKYVPESQEEGHHSPDVECTGEQRPQSGQPSCSGVKRASRDPSLDVECTGAELSNQPLSTPQTIDLQTCYICQGTSDQESIMICDGRGCSVIAHLHCYFSAGSQDANDAITDIEHWHCENCGGLPRHMHPRPPAAKRARVSFGPDLAVATETPITQRGSATGHQSGGWGGLKEPMQDQRQDGTTGTWSEAPGMQMTNSQEDLEMSINIIDSSDHRTGGRRQTRKKPQGLQPGHDAVVEITTCHFCRRADLWLYLTCGVCQLTTHAKCYYRLGSDEAAYCETNSSDW